jgi:hypothetical protein
MSGMGRGSGRRGSDAGRGAAVLILFGSLLLAAPPGGAQTPPVAAPLPVLTSAPGDAFSRAEEEALLAWVLARPEFQSHVGSDRIRLIRMGSDQPKGSDGPYRRATLYFRNYPRGLAHRVYVNLASGAVQISDLTSLVQPGREELEAARAIVRRDPEFARYFSDAGVEVSGGFYERSPVAGDPCARDICVTIGIVRRRPGQGFARQVVVNLSREQIAHRDYRTPPVGAPPNRMSAPEAE